MNHTDPMGRLLLKTAGTLMIVFGIFGILIYLTLLAVLVGVRYVTGGIFSGTTDIVGVSLLLAASVTEFVAGIKAVRTVRRAGKARGCRVWTVLTLVLGLAALVHMLLRRQDPFLWIGVPIAVVTPAACLIGLSRSAAEEDPAEETDEETSEDPSEAPAEEQTEQS